jgi:hypothetical protein
MTQPMSEDDVYRPSLTVKANGKFPRPCARCGQEVNHQQWLVLVVGEGWVHSACVGETDLEVGE